MHAEPFHIYWNRFTCTHTKRLTNHLLKKEISEKHISLARPKVIEQRLRYIAAVFEKAKHGDEHLNELNGREFLHSLHVVYALCDAALVWNDKIPHKQWTFLVLNDIALQVHCGPL